MVMAESLGLMEQHGDQQAILDSMGDAPMSSSAGAVVALSVDLSVGVGDVPCSEPIDDDAFEASQVLLQSTTPDVLRTPWLHTIRSNGPVVRLEEADADREHQLLLESQMVMAENFSLAEQHNDQQAILVSTGDAPMSSSAGAVVALSVDPSVGVGGSTAATSGVRLVVVLLDASTVLLLVATAGSPSGSTLRVLEDVAGSNIRAGGYLAAVNNARRFSSPRQAETIISNSRTLELPVRLVFIRSSSAPPTSDTPQLAEGTVLILPYTGAAFDELNFLGELLAPSLGASSLDGDTTLPNRVLICPRDGCGRHAARQAGDPAGPALYCCIPCAQLEGHSARCSRVYSQHTLLGEPTGPPPGDGAHPHGPGLAEVGSFGTRWQSGAVGASATGAPVDDVVVDESFLSAVRTSQASEPSPALLLEQIRSSPVFLRSLESPGLFEICAGHGTLSDAYDAEGIAPRLLSEIDEFDQRYLCFRFPPPAFVLGDFFDGQCQCSASVLVVTGGISCAFCSPAGQQLGARDLRSPICTDALPWAARYFNAAFADFENVPAIGTADHGSVLRALDHNFATVGYERVPRVNDSPLRLEVVSPGGS